MSAEKDSEFLELVCAVIKKQLDGEESDQEVRDIVATVLSEEWLANILQHQNLSADFSGMVCDQLTAKPKPVLSSEQPTLFVELGSEFHVGCNITLDFHLMVPLSDSVLSPSVIARCSKGLNGKDTWDERPRLRREGRSYWSFTEEITINEPGSFLVDLEFSFGSPVNEELGRFLRASLKVRVPPPGLLNNRKLEIECEGNSLVNYQGCDLSSFATISLKGKGNSIQNFLQVSHSNQNSAQQEETILRHLIPLKRNYERTVEHPFISSAKGFKPSKSRTLGLEFENGHRTLILNQIQIQMGRDDPSKNPRNDIALRWIPMDEKNRERSLRISGEHVRLGLDQFGIRVTDLNSTRGTSSNKTAVVKGGSICIDLEKETASHGLTLAEDFELELTAYPFAEQIDSFDDDPLFPYAAEWGGRLPQLWNYAQRLGINAMRISRLSNFREEEYILLLRSVTIGHTIDCAVRLHAWEAVDVPARIIAMEEEFYFQRLVGKEVFHVSVDGHEPDDNELIPLCFGQTIRIGRSTIKVGEFQQTL